MVALSGPEDRYADSRRPIPAHAQLLAVAWLRWRIFINNFRRQRADISGVALVSTIVLRIIVWGFLGLGLIGTAVFCGFLAWNNVADGSPLGLLSLLAGIALFWQILSLNGLSIAATVPSFDPSSLIRFPLRFGRYLLLRILFGLLTASTIAGCLALLAAAIGIGIANRALLLPALVVLAIYALMNVFLTRMIEAWLERWLAIRRFREIFAVLMGLFFVGIQFLNFPGASARPHHAASSPYVVLLHKVVPFLHWLPPGFAASSIVLTPSAPLTALEEFSALFGFTALFLYLFAIRIRKQFLGEFLSEGMARSTSSASVDRLRRSEHPLAVQLPVLTQTTRPTFSPVISACLRKEWLTLQGNTAQLIRMFTPLIFVVILKRGLFTQYPAAFLPGAIGYVLFGPIAGLYNIFGGDGPGVQLYLLAPVRLRDVVIAKNIASVIMILAQALLAWVLVSVLAASAAPLPAQVSAALWTVFLIVVNLTVGTVRSIQAPRRFIPGQARQARSTPTNRTSGFLVLAVLLGSLFLQVPVSLVCSYFGQPWLAALIFLPLAAVAIAAYTLLLRRADRLILSHRDLLCEELCKV